ncbi:HEAT repeat domain-containing protein [Candidatus Micrarchaeota archaeon]|nr:HEAT repeat domain-containing protein [Candidatus Micrarchaeota archaeon]
MKERFLAAPRRGMGKEGKQVVLGTARESSRREFSRLAGAALLLAPLMLPSVAFPSGKKEEINLSNKEIERLGLLGQECAVPTLIGILNSRKSVTTKQYAAQALGRIGGEKAERALLKVVKNRLNEEDLRDWALMALGEIGGEKALDAAIASMKDRSITIRYTAIDVASGIGGGKAEKALLPMIRDRSDFVRCRAVEMVGKLRVEKAVPGLRRILKNPREFEYVKEEAIGALNRIGGEAASKALEEASHKNLAKTKEKNAIEILGRESGNLSTASIATALSHRSANVRIKAAKLLGKRDSRESADALIGALEDGHARVRAYAAESLGKIGRGAGALIDLLDKEKVIWVRQMVLLALADMECRNALPTIIGIVEEGLRNKNYDIEELRIAVSVLGTLGDSSNIPLLERVREQYGLGHVGSNAFYAIGKIQERCGRAE